MKDCPECQTLQNAASESPETKALRDALRDMNSQPDVSGDDSERLRELCRITTVEVKATSMVSAATSLEMVGYIRELESSRRRTASVGADAAAFQARVDPWLLTCFGEQIARDKEERNHRFLEEALELVQACGCSQSEARQLVDYAFDRLSGEASQEVGGTMVTLAALCLANGLDMYEAGETELARIWMKVETIRAKQAAKPKNSPLPAASPSDAATVETGNLYGVGGEVYTFVHAMRMQSLNDPQHPLMSRRAQELLDKIVAHDSEVEAIARRITEECKAEESATSAAAEIVAETPEMAIIDALRSWNQLASHSARSRKPNTLAQTGIGILHIPNCYRPVARRIAYTRGRGDDSINQTTPLSPLWPYMVAPVNRGTNQLRKLQ